MRRTDIAVPFFAAATRRAHDEVLHAFTAESCTTPKGTFSLNDLAQLRGDSARLVAAESFYALDGLVFALVHPLVRVGEGWRRTGAALLVPSGEFRHFLLYRERNDVIQAYIPKW